MKPCPIIYLPKPEDQEKLVRALWRDGYRYMSGRPDANEDETWIDWSGTNLCRRFPYVFVDPYKRMSAYPARSDEDAYTLMNSIPHFLSYTRHLGAPPTP